MSYFLLLRLPLLLVFVASAVVAGEREPNERSIYLSEHPSHEAPEVYVVGGVVTVLRLELPCDPARTKMPGWEGRFEPLACAGKRVVLEPLHDIEPKDRFTLLVTLVDGTEMSFTVTSCQKTTDDRTGDQQVNVFRDTKAPAAVLAALYASLGRERELKEVVERYEKEDSVDHFLAALLIKDAEKMTPFRPGLKQLVKGPDGVDVLISVSVSKKDNKVAVVFNVTNNNPVVPWSLMEARLVTEQGHEHRPFALRASRTRWAPGGETGKIAVVMNAKAFDSRNGLERLVLELFRNGDGLRQAYVVLDRQLLAR